MDVETYDYIIIGAGSAGSVLANRLSADPNQRVLLLEAGPARNFWSAFPIGYAKLINNPSANWCFSSEPEASTNGRKLPVPRGRLLGGSSSINGLVFVRGQANDYNTWAQMGNRGWSYDDVLPYFKRLENYDGGENFYRGRNGPLRVTDPDEPGLLYDTIMAAAQEVGIPKNPDYNGATQEGIAMSQATISNGRRMSTAYCYLDPIKKRKNLKISVNSHTTKLVLENKRCTGVLYEIKGKLFKADARREVIISAGTINSPQILEISGIGNPTILKENGVEVNHVSPGVGENLRDHYAPRTRWEIAAPGVTYNDKARGLGIVWQAMRYLATKKGMMGIPAAPMRAFIKTREGLDAPDGLLGWLPLLYDTNYKLSKTSGVICYAHAMRPESTGHVHIVSSNPKQPPKIQYNFLSTQLDIDTTINAVRTVRSIMTAPIMKKLNVSELKPGATETSDEQLLDWVRENGETTYHPVGTCKMGNDPNAVVDQELKVHGITSLRVADASIMPTLISGNTNAPSIMIGEKAADLIIKDYKI